MVIWLQMIASEYGRKTFDTVVSVVVVTHIHERLPGLASCAAITPGLSELRDALGGCN